MKRLVVRLTTLSLLGAAVLTSLPAFADNMGTAGAANYEITLKSSSDLPPSLAWVCKKGGKRGSRRGGLLLY